MSRIKSTAFIEIWNSCHSLSEVCEKTNLRQRQATHKASGLRSYGFPLKEMRSKNKKTAFVGEVFGNWTVKEELPGNMRLCQCVCGELRIVKAATLMNGTSTGCYCNRREVCSRGEDHYAWKGNAANPSTKRHRCQKAYAIDKCELCSAKATDRHHVDGDTGNNARTNIQFLCRRCHMSVDGRLERLKAIGKENAIANKKPPRPCVNCKKLVTKIWHGQCHTCDVYERRTGRKRPCG